MPSIVDTKWLKSIKLNFDNNKYMNLIFTKKLEKYFLVLRWKVH